MSALGATELSVLVAATTRNSITWPVVSGSADTIHQVQFQVVNRQDAEGNVRDPEPWETGYKDTVISYPDEITRIKARFDIPGRFVWHCHIVEHEDNEMMRPYNVL